MPAYSWKFETNLVVRGNQARSARVEANEEFVFEKETGNQYDEHAVLVKKRSTGDIVGRVEKKKSKCIATKLAEGVNLKAVRRDRSQTNRYQM